MNDLCSHYRVRQKYPYKESVKSNLNNKTPNQRLIRNDGAIPLLLTFVAGALARQLLTRIVY